MTNEQTSCTGIIEILDGKGQVINTVMACENFARQSWPGRWRHKPQAPAPLEPARPVPVPTTITRAQGKAALIQAGLWPQVLAFVAAIDDAEEKPLAETALHDTVHWERESPFLRKAAQALGLTDEKLDELFVAAGGITL